MKMMTLHEIVARVDEIIASSFPPGTIPAGLRMDPEGDGFFVMLDDPTNDFEYVEIFVNHDGTWEG